MNSNVLYNSIRFVLLLMVQIVLFNNLTLFGIATALPYILFIILYPVNGSKYGVLVFSFILGLIMDTFLNSGGVHATACLITAFARPTLFKTCFGLSYEYQTVKLNEDLTPERFSFILLTVILHHFVLFFFEAFQVTFFLDLIIRIISSTLYTLVSSILILYFIKPSRK